MSIPRKGRLERSLPVEHPAQGAGSGPGLAHAAPAAAPCQPPVPALPRDIAAEPRATQPLQARA